MQLIVAVNCTSRKTAKAGKALCARNLGRGEIDQVAQEWLAQVQGASVQRVPVHELYAGRAFSLASKTAAGAGADLFVLSAGMGFVKHNALVPPYSLSVAPGTDDCVLRRARKLPFTASQWWAALHEPGRSQPLARLLRARPKALMVLAATRPYIEMVQEDLASLTAAQASRLRIVGLTRPAALPETLRPSVMPYDDRLDDADLGLQGTRFDFAARALSHFVGLVGGDDQIQSPQDHARRVRLSLSKRQAPVRAERERLDAVALERHVRTLKKAGESKTSALSKLRRELGYACEQQRFFSAWEA